MRWLSGMFLAVAMATGCTPPATPPAKIPTEANTPAQTSSTAPASPALRTNRVTLPARYPAFNPINPVQGRVTFLNEKSRFVIVDFAFYQMPRVGQRLGVYRRDVRIGEVRISGPTDGTAIVADLMSGEAGLGDQVREDAP